MIEEKVISSKEIEDEYQKIFKFVTCGDLSGWDKGRDRTLKKTKNSALCDKHSNKQ